MQSPCNGCGMILPMIQYLNPCIYDDYKLRYYELTKNQTQNNFMVTILSPFSYIPYIKGGCTLHAFKKKSSTH
jgi:hypothetical protein